jgi:hypothetical protein
MYYNARKISLGTLSLNIVVPWDVSDSELRVTGRRTVHEYMHGKYFPLYLSRSRKIP